MNAGRSDDESQPPTQTRGQRQRDEILSLLACQQLHRAADLLHEHLAEYRDEQDVQGSVVAALRASTDPRLRRRAGEFPTE